MNVTRNPTKAEVLALIKSGQVTKEEGLRLFKQATGAPNSEELRGTPRNSEEPPKGIAVVGISGRFPGAATVRVLWRNLVEG